MLVHNTLNENKQVIYKVEDWKLEARAVVQLCRKKCDKSVSLSVLSMTNITANFIKVLFGHMKFRAPDSFHITNAISHYASGDCKFFSRHFILFYIVLLPSFIKADNCVHFSLFSASLVINSDGPVAMCTTLYAECSSLVQNAY